MKPHITANKLASFITSQSPERRRAIVRALKRSAGTDFPQYYSALRNPARRFLASGATSTNELLQLIERMAERGGTKWLETDGRITAEAAQALIDNSAQLRSLPFRFFPPASRVKAIWEHPRVDVSVTPHLLVATRGKESASGALRFYIAKESTYELGVRGAQLVAMLLHLWQRGTTPLNAVPQHCLVLECFQQRITPAPANPSPLELTIHRGCEDFARMWHMLDTEEAA